MEECDPALDRLQHAVKRLAEQTRGRAITGLTHDNADGTVGSIRSDDALAFDPLPLLRTLARYGARVAVMGQAAGIMHGSHELTGDLDLLWDGDVEQGPALAAAFGSVAAALVLHSSMTTLIEIACLLSRVDSQPTCTRCG